MLALANQVRNAFNLQRKGFKDPERPFDVSVFSLTLFKYAATLTILSVALASATQAFGEKIICHTNKNVKFDRRLFETMCWADGVFTVVREHDNANLGDHIHGNIDEERTIAPGVIPYYKAHDDVYSKRKHNYYPWIWLLLSFQSILCSLPYAAWKRLENKFIRSLVSKNMFGKLDIDKPEELANRFDKKRHHFKALVYELIGCHIFGLIIIIVIMSIVDTYLGGDGIFWNLGTAISSVSGFKETSTSTVEVPNPLKYIFPLSTKCTIDYFGYNGQINKVDGLCMLPLNMINEKIYVILWYVLWFLFISTLLSLVGYFLAYLSPTIRVYFIKRKLPSEDISRETLSIIPIYGLSEWFVLCQLGNNLTPDEFIPFVESLKEIKDKRYQHLQSLNTNGKTIPTMV